MNDETLFLTPFIMAIAVFILIRLEVATTGDIIIGFVCIFFAAIMFLNSLSKGGKK